MAKASPAKWKSAPRETLSGRTRSNRRVATQLTARHGPGKKPRHTSEGRASTARAGTRRTAAARTSTRNMTNVARKARSR